MDLIEKYNKTQSCFVISDATKKIIYVSETFLTMTGYKKNEVIGKNCSFLQGPNTNKDTIKKISKSLKNGELIDEILLNYTKNKCSFWVRLQIQPIKDDNDNIIQYIGFQTILSQKKAYEVNNNNGLGINVYKTGDNYIKCAKCGEMINNLEVYNHAKKCFKL